MESILFMPVLLQKRSAHLTYPDEYAKRYRIRAGATDADTSLSVSTALALKLQNAGCGSMDYALVWDQLHSETDYPGDVLKWIDSICG